MQANVPLHVSLQTARELESHHLTNRLGQAEPGEASLSFWFSLLPFAFSSKSLKLPLEFPNGTDCKPLRLIFAANFGYLWR